MRRVNETEDAREGIYHLKPGTAAGLTKSVSFTREENPHIAVANYLNEGKLNLGFFRTTYRINVDMIGNTIFKPGMTIYLNTEGLIPDSDPKIAKQLGIAGYYNILTTSSTIGVSGYKTTLNAKWVMGGE